MKILFAITHTQAGGATLVWSDLANAFASRGYEVATVALYPFDNTLSTWHYCIDHPPKSKVDGLNAIRTSRSLVRILSPHAIFTALPAANIIFALSTLLRKKTKVFTSQHTPAETYNQKLNYLDGVIGATPIVDAVVCVSDAVRQSLTMKPTSYRQKLRVIKNALPPSIESITDRLVATRRVKPLGRQIIASGRLAPQKNLAVLIRAMVHVHNASLKIVGHGPDEGALRHLAQQLGVADRVSFLGWKPREDALNWIAASDIFVQPSLFEGHSLALVEAAKLGLPIVVSNVPSQIDGITRSDGVQCGLVADVNDEVGLASAIVSLLEDPTRRARYAGLSRSLAKETTFSTMVDRYEELLWQST